MAERGVIFAETPAKQIAKAAREFARRTVNEKPHRARWQQNRGSSTQIRWGKVTAGHGCGWYTIELGTLDGSSDASASLSGSGTECSPFGVITGEGTEGCSTSISLRPERVIGSGVFVEAYDPASTVIPLIAGTDCIVWKSGGSAAGSGSASTSGSGSGTTSSGWGVLRGRMNELLKYEEDGECCASTGEWVTTRKKPFIFVGIEGEWIDCADCPSGSA